MEHIVEMIQLQFGTQLNPQKHVIILDDDGMDAFEKSYDGQITYEAIFINQDVLLTTTQEKLLNRMNVFIIPNSYFDFELREADELW